MPLVAAAPLDRLMVETDCPYLAPEPYRGKKSHSGLIALSAAKIAAVRGVSTAQVLQTATQNGKRLFGVS